MTHYLLDANTVIVLLNDRNSKVAKRLTLHKPADIFVSVIVLHELFYGAFKSRRKEHNIGLIDDLRFQFLEFDDNDARQAGEIRAHLAQQGLPIGPYDVLIAAQAKARGMILVTHNTNEFRRIPGLKMEDWEYSF